MNKPVAFHALKHGPFDITVLSDGPIEPAGEIFKFTPKTEARS